MYVYVRRITKSVEEEAPCSSVKRHSLLNKRDKIVLWWTTERDGANKSCIRGACGRELEACSSQWTQYSFCSAFRPSVVPSRLFHCTSSSYPPFFSSRSLVSTSIFLRGDTCTINPSPQH